MNGRKENAAWRKAYEIGRDIHELTQKIHPANTIIQTLRDRSAAVPITLGMVHASDDAPQDHVRTAYEHAHDTEYLLFCTMALRYLSLQDVRGLITRVHAVKALLLAGYTDTQK